MQPMLHFFFFNDTATTEIYTLSLHDALPIYRARTTEVHLRELVGQHQARVAELQLGVSDPSVGLRHAKRFRGAERLLVELDGVAGALDAQVRRERVMAFGNGLDLACHAFTSTLRSYRSRLGRLDRRDRDVAAIDAAHHGDGQGLTDGRRDEPTMDVVDGLHRTLPDRDDEIPGLQAGAGRGRGGLQAHELDRRRGC